MADDAAKSLVTVFLAMACLLLSHVTPGFCSSRSLDASMVVAVGPSRHVIKSGETLNLLAKRYGVPAAAILKANPGLDPRHLALGKEILIPTGAKTPASPAETKSVTPLEQPPQGLELRPEKAPQATKPLTGGPVGHDLVDSPGRQPTRTPAPAPTPSAAAQPAQPVASVPAAKASVPDAPAAQPPRETAPANPATTGDSGGVEGVFVPLAIAVLVLALAIVLIRGFCANLFAGFGLRALRFFRLGDSIRVGGHEGRVIARGLLYVTLRTAENSRVFVPNARMVREIVEVYSSTSRTSESDA